MPCFGARTLSPFSKFRVTFSGFGSGLETELRLFIPKGVLLAYLLNPPVPMLSYDLLDVYKRQGQYCQVAL